MSKVRQQAANVPGADSTPILRPWLATGMRYAQHCSQAILIRIIHRVLRPQAAFAQKLTGLIITIGCIPNAVNVGRVGRYASLFPFK